MPFSCLADFVAWRWRRHVLPKRQFTYGLHGAVSQKMTSLITTAERTSDLTCVSQLHILHPCILWTETTPRGLTALAVVWILGPTLVGHRTVPAVYKTKDMHAYVTRPVGVASRQRRAVETLPHEDSPRTRWDPNRVMRWWIRIQFENKKRINYFVFIEITVGPRQHSDSLLQVSLPWKA
jgi:hypothetical protein